MKTLRILCLIICLLLYKQDVFSLSYTLKDCIRIGTTKNTQVKHAEASAHIAAEAKKNASNAYVPALSISISNNLSTGRVLDPTTYQFVTNRTVYDMNAVIGGSMTLFSGFERIRNIQKAKNNLQSAFWETEKTKNDVVLNVTALFLNIVLDKEAIAICERKISMLEDQEDAIRKKLEYKVATPGDLLNIQADITNAKVGV